MGKIEAYSAGNPYYATEICGRVYDDMITRKDHYVSVGDVESAVAAVCDEAGPSTFQHFWTDGVFNMGPDLARLQYLNAAVLTACARGGGGDENSPVRRDDLLSEATLRRYDPTEVRFRLDNLIDRGVLRPSGDLVQIRLPLLSSWLRGAGEAAVRSSFSEEDLETGCPRY